MRESRTGLPMLRGLLPPKPPNPPSSRLPRIEPAALQEKLEADGLFLNKNERNPGPNDRAFGRRRGRVQIRERSRLRLTQAGIAHSRGRYGQEKEIGACCGD